MHPCSWSLSSGFWKQILDTFMVKANNSGISTIAYLNGVKNKPSHGICEKVWKMSKLLVCLLSSLDFKIKIDQKQIV